MNLSTTGARRTAAVALAGGLVLSLAPLASPAHAASATAAPKVSGKGAYLLNNASGAKLFGKSDGTRRQMASTTKIMTAAVVLTTKNVDLDRKVTVKQTYRDYVAREGASKADLRTGDKLTVRQLLYGMMLPSGCDAAYALADAYGSGTSVSARTSSFISKMNKKASSLGLKNTKFDSFDGISRAGNNYTTPSDLARIARSAMGNSTFRGVVKATSYQAKAKASNGKTRTYTWYNTNRLLGSYKGAIGIKTGTGTKAGPCLVFAATRGGKTLVGVVLNGQDRYKDAAKLLDHGFGGKAAAPSMHLRVLPRGAQHD